MADDNEVAPVAAGQQGAAVSEARSFDLELRADWLNHREYVWQHLLHENEVFNSLLNFFLVFESVSVAGFIALVTSDHDHGELSSWGKVALVLLGMATTLIWAYVQAKLLFLLQHPFEAIRENDDYFKWLQYKRNLFRGAHWYGWILKLEYWKVLCFVPVLFLLIWCLVGGWVLWSDTRGDVDRSRGRGCEPVRCQAGPSAPVAAPDH